MKALLCTRASTPDDLTIGDLPDPVAGSGQAVVRVEAVALNFFDLLIIAGKYTSTATIATLDSDALVFDTQTRVYLNSGISEYAVIIAIRGFKFEVQESNPEGCQRVAGGRSEAKTTG